MMNAQTSDLPSLRTKPISPRHSRVRLSSCSCVGFRRACDQGILDLAYATKVLPVCLSGSCTSDVFYWALVDAMT